MASSTESTVSYENTYQETSRNCGMTYTTVSTVNVVRTIQNNHSEISSRASATYQSIWVYVSGRTREEGPSKQQTIQYTKVSIWNT